MAYIWRSFPYVLRDVPHIVRLYRNNSDDFTDSSRTEAAPAPTNWHRQPSARKSTMSHFKLLKYALPVMALLTSSAYFATSASAGDGGSHSLTFNGKGQNGEPIYMNNGKGSAGDTHGLNFTNSGKADRPGEKNGEPIYMNNGKGAGKIDPPNPDFAGKGRNGAGDAMALDASHPANTPKSSVHPDLMKTGK
jgi:hypothetical protein